MSAFVDKQRLYQAVCDECHWSGPLTPVEDDADDQAAAQDLVTHDPYDRDDDA